jgi:hypothetical protein
VGRKPEPPVRHLFLPRYFAAVPAYHPSSGVIRKAEQPLRNDPFRPVDCTTRIHHG